MSDRSLETMLAIAEGRPVCRRQRRVAAHLERDGSLIAELDRQRRVVHALRAGGPAPSHTLAARLGALAASRDRRECKRSLPIRRWVAPLAAAATVIALAFVVAGGQLTGGGSLPTAVRVSAVWTLPGGGAPVAAAPGNAAQLDVSYRGIVFPNYRDREGWHPVGLRRDRIDGVMTVTVFYATADRRAAYTVVLGTGLAVPAGASRLHAGGLPLREFRAGNRWIVAFERAGNTCVLTAAAPRERQWLIKLAAWHGGQ